jgi:hypothetical protein
MAMLTMAVMFILAVAAAVNLWLYVEAHRAGTFATIRGAMYATPDVRIAEAMSHMHPDAISALTARQRVLWRRKYIPQKDLVDEVLDEAPSVHLGFLAFVLDHSGRSLMPKRMLSEGSKQFDPDGMVTDYQQYDDLVLLLEAKLLTTKPMGNQPPVFIPPANVALVRHMFGLDDDGSVEEIEKTKTVGRAEARGQGAEREQLREALGELEQTAEMRARTIAMTR